MGTTAESNVKNYLVDDQTQDQFYNICNFAKRLTLKDSKLYYDAENPTSKWFGDLMVKYFDVGLTKKEAEEMINFVENYNSRIDEKLGYDKNTNEFKDLSEINVDSEKEKISNFRLKSLGLHKDQPFDSSIINLIYLSLYNDFEKIKNKVNDLVVMEEDIKVLKNFICKQIFDTYFSEYKNNISITNLKFQDIDAEVRNPGFIDNYLLVYYKDNETFSLISPDNKNIQIVEPTKVKIKQKIDENNYEIYDKYWNGNTFGDVTINENTSIYYPADKYDNTEGADNSKYEYNFIDNILVKTDKTYKFRPVCTRIKIGSIEYIYNNDIYNSGFNIEFDDNDDLTKTDNIYLKTCSYFQEYDNSYILKKSEIETEYDIKFYKYQKPVNATKIYVDGKEFKYDESSFNGLFDGLSQDTFTISCQYEGEYWTYNRSFDVLYKNKKIQKPVNATKIYVDGKEFKYDESFDGLSDELPSDVNIISCQYEDNDWTYNKSSDMLYKDDTDVEYSEDTNILINNNIKIIYNDYNFFYNKNIQQLIEDGLNLKVIFDNLKNAMFNKNKIFFKIRDSITIPNEKFKASESEKLLLKDTNNIYINLRFDSTDYTFIYKEFNNEYRKLLNSSLIEIYLASTIYNKIVADNIFDLLHPVSNLNYQYTSISDSMGKYLRTIKNSDILIREFPKNKITTNHIKYEYCNAYLARTANESDIIKYYVADPYNLEGYGRYGYQKEEINLFLETYSELRNYFYKVLLNESFVNEEEYHLYEKSFLLFWAIEKFLTAKIEMIRDINLFDQTDIKNFLTTYGMEKLAKILDTDDFYSSEEYSKNLIKSFIELVQNKGSRKVMQVIEGVFDTATTKLDVYKTLLLNTRTSAEDSNGTYYSFLKIDYDTDNILYEIYKNKTKESRFDLFINKDKYWKKENTEFSLLNTLNVQNETTKYLTPEITEEISLKYFITRHIFSLIDFYFDKFDDTQKGNLTIDSVNLSNYIKKIRELLVQFYKSDFDKYNSAYDFKISKYNFKIDSNYLESVIKNFYDTNNNYSLKKSEMEKIIVCIDEKSENYIFLKNILESLRPLVIMTENEDNNTNISNMFSSIYSISYENLIQENFNTIFIDTVLYLPNIFLDGYNGKKLIECEWLDSSLYQFVKEIYTKIFFKENADDIIFTTNKYSPSENIEDVPQLIINYCKELGNILGQIVEIRMAESEKNTLTFLNEVIEYFISYTSQIYDSSYIKVYNSPNESIDLTDTIKIMKTIPEIDSFYYDEQLDIVLEDK